MANLNPYINFPGNTREAMTFYQECLGGKLFFQPIEGTPMEAQCPAAMKGQILHSSLTSDGLVIMASDMTSPDGTTTGNGNMMAISVNCDSEEQTNKWFSALAQDGHVIDTLKRQFWGAMFGALTDKFGIRWMLNCENPQS